MSTIYWQFGDPNHGPHQARAADATPAAISHGTRRRFMEESISAILIGMACMDPVAAAWLASNRAQGDSANAADRRR